MPLYMLIKLELNLEWFFLTDFSTPHEIEIGNNIPFYTIKLLGTSHKEQLNFKVSSFLPSSSPPFFLSLPVF